MVDLNDQEALKKLDPKDVYGSTGMLADQCKQIWEEAKGIEFPQGYSSVDSIVVCGMGGSAYGGYVVSALFKDQLKASLTSNNNYHLPAFVTEKTLVILSSYSGSTEEVLSCAEEALEKKLKIVGISGGGKLGEILKENNLPALIFDSKFNPSGQPRLGTGYMILGMIGLLNKLGLITASDEEVRQAIAELEQSHEAIKKQAQEMASKIQGFIPLIVGAEFLSGNVRITRNQFNETAKSFAEFAILPELNHHLMEGLKNPQDKKIITLFIESGFYSDKLNKRVEVTKDVVGKNNVSFLEYQAPGSTKLSQMLNVLSFGGYLSLYLAFLYDQDPSVIPWVDYFKEQLAR